MVERYGQSIGRATAAIDAGRHVHTHNLGFEELALAYEFPDRGSRPAPARARTPTFLGYAREDGRVGTRNYIAVVAASNCAAHTAELIAAKLSSARRCRPTWMAWWPFRTARAAGTLSVPTWTNCGALWAACWCIPTFRRR